ncbi:16S rRNA (guanine(527)-N(7))-methyltransferase RsmG [Lachnospiraceae bacterium JLR.KK008]
MVTEDTILLEKYETSYFVEDLQELSLTLDKRQICQFLKYYNLLVEWNSFMNLTGITEYPEVIKKHFIDSLSVVKCIDLLKINSVIDIGTGAGFPGIPLKIVFPHLKITLLDSLQKRIRFLDEVIGELELSGIETIHGRAEEFAKPDKLRAKYDLSVSRAVANLSTLSEYCIPFVKKDGFFLSYKSEKISEELSMAERAIHVLGGELMDRVDFTLPRTDMKRTILLIKKVKETPLKFPRKSGLPSKEPIH